MSEMVERVVASLRAKRRELIHQPLDRVWLDLARAAIEAMREPTEAMKAAGSEPCQTMTQAMRMQADAGRI